MKITRQSTSTNGGGGGGGSDRRGGVFAADSRRWFVEINWDNDDRWDAGEVAALKRVASEMLSSGMSISQDGRVLVSDHRPFGNRGHTATMFTARASAAARREYIAKRAAALESALDTKHALEEMKLWVADGIVAKRRRVYNGKNDGSGRESACTPADDDSRHVNTDDKSTAADEYLVQWKHFPSHEATWVPHNVVEKYYPYQLKRFRDGTEMFNNARSSIEDVGSTRGDDTTGGGDNGVCDADNAVNTSGDNGIANTLDVLEMSIIGSLYRLGNIQLLVDDWDIVDLNALGGHSGIQSLILENAHLIRSVLKNKMSDADLVTCGPPESPGQQQQQQQHPKMVLTDECRQLIAKYYKIHDDIDKEISKITLAIEAEQRNLIEREKNRLKSYIQKMVSQSVAPQLCTTDKEDITTKVFY